MKKYMFQIIIVLLCITGLLFRLAYFNYVTFTYDQARDALAALSLWHGHPIRIIGPQTDLPGLFHGPLYWYIISPFYFFSNNVYIVRLFLIVINLLTLLPLYFLTNKLFNNKVTTILSLFLFCISFEAVEYARWISNPAPAVLTITSSFLFLWMYLQGNKKALFLTFFFWGLSVQFQLLLVYQCVVFVAIIWLTKKKLLFKDIVLGSLGALIPLSTFIIAQIKFGFPALKSMESILTSSKTSNVIERLSNTFNLTSDKYIHLFYFNISGISILFSEIVLFIFIVYLLKKIRKKDKPQLTFLTLWMLSPLLTFLFSFSNAYFFVEGAMIPLIILCSYMLVEAFYQKYIWLFYAFIVCIVVGNLKLIHDYSHNGEAIFIAQQQTLYGDETHVIDWVYQQANGKPFRIDTITDPLYINTTWAFLFSSYGQKKYGYMPFWWGYPQDGQFGNEINFSTDFANSKQTLFLISEPISGIPKEYAKAIEKFENTRSVIEKTTKFGEYRVEKRHITADKAYSREDIDKYASQTH